MRSGPSAARAEQRVVAVDDRAGARARSRRPGCPAPRSCCAAGCAACRGSAPRPSRPTCRPSSPAGSGSARRRSSAGCRSSTPRRRRSCPAVWPGALISSGIGAISAAFCARQPAPLARLRERHAVVGRHHDQRLVPHALLLEVLPEVLQLVVGEAGLEEVALEQHVELRLPLERLVREARDGVVGLAAVAARVGQVLPGHVRQQRVLEVERRAPARLDVLDPLLEARLAAAVEVRARAALGARAAEVGAPPPTRRRSCPSSPTPTPGRPPCRAARPRAARPARGPRSST